MNRVVIKVPQKDSKWKWSYNGKVKKHYLNANTLLNSLSNAFLKARSKDKTRVRVNYGGGYHNETIPSENYLEQLWSTSCFLEDYISKETLDKYERQYFKKVV